MNWRESMWLDVDNERRQALIDLLSRPDTPDLRRGHHQTVEGRADRYRLVHDLAASFVMWHQVQREEHVAEWESSAAIVPPS